SRRRHTRWPRDWSSDVCSSDLAGRPGESSAILGSCARLRGRGTPRRTAASPRGPWSRAYRARGKWFSTLPWSLLLDAGFLDEVAPHPVIGSVALGERFDRAADRLGAGVEEPLAQLRLVEHLLHLRVQKPHDRGRRAARREDAEPCAHLPARQAGP